VSDESLSPTLSLLTARLPKQSSDFVKISEQLRWRVCKETIAALHDLIFEIVIDDFDAEVAKMYEECLRRMMSSIDQSAEKYKYGKNEHYEGYQQVLDYLGACRADLGVVIRYHGKSPAEHQAAMVAVNALQKHLKKVLQYVKPIDKWLNPETAATGPPSAPADKPQG
jgi:hypothetical protein